MASNDPKLPASYTKLFGNLTTAASSIGAGGGGGTGRPFLKIDDRTGAATFGPNRDPFPLKHRFAVNLRSFQHGYVVF